MAISNSQMDTILKKYEDTRLKNFHLQQARKEQVYKTVDGYKELDESTVSVSMDVARRKLSGDPNATKELHKLLEDLKAMKKQLLIGAGFPGDYLEPLYDCKDCRDTGYIDREKCHCLKQQLINVLYEQSNIVKHLQNNNFSTLRYDFYKGEDLEAFKRTVEKCHTFVDTFGTVNKNLFLYGTVGTGKSFLSGCIAKELLDKGYSVIYFSASSFFNALAKETFDAQYRKEQPSIYEHIYNCDLLIIDDLGTETTNKFTTAELFSCINERSLRGKSIVISSNLLLNELRDRYSDRIFSRIISSFDACKLSGPDIRILLKTNS